MSNSVPALISDEPAASTVDLDDVLSLLRRRASLIISIVVAATVIATVMVLFAIPQFTAVGALYLGDADTSGGGGNTGSSSDIGVFSDNPNTSDVTTQVDLLTAAGTVQQAVLETGLNTEIVPSGSHELNYMRWRFGYGTRITAFQPGSNSLLAQYAFTPGSYSIVLGDGGSYKLFSRSGLFHRPSFVLAGMLGQPASGNGVQILIKPAGADFEGRPGSSYDLTVASPVTTAQSLVGHALTVAANGKIANLIFRWSNPYQAQAFLNQLLQDFIASQLTWKSQSASTTEQFISSQLVNVGTSLAAADKNLAAYQSATGIVDVTQSSQDVTTKLTNFKNQRLALQLQQESLTKFAAQLDNTKGSLSPYLATQSNDSLLSSLTTSLSAAEVDLAGKQVQYTSNSPELQLAQAKVAELQSSIKTTVQNDLAAVNQSLASLDALIAELQSQSQSLPAESLKVMSYQRSADVLGKLYVLLMQKKEEAEIAKAATIINTRIVTPVAVPPIATSPKAAIYLMGGVIGGLVVALGLVFGQRALSGRFESEQEIRQSVRLPIFGSLPRHNVPDFTGNILGGGRSTPFSEAFRLLRASIYRRAAPDRSMIIQLISSSRAEGTTTVAENLAKILADDGRRVVLIDGDLRPVKLSEQLRADSLRGMEGALTDIFGRLREDYEFIILDSPPLPASADGMILGVFADLILSVVSVSLTRRRRFAAHNELLGSLDRAHGIVINMIEARAGERESSNALNPNWFGARGAFGQGWPKAGEGQPKSTSALSISLSDYTESRIEEIQ